MFSRIVYGAQASMLVGFLAFPLLLFAIALAGVSPNEMLGLTGNGLRMAMQVFIGFFSWPYISRDRSEGDAVVAEAGVRRCNAQPGARCPYILFKEKLPNLVARSWCTRR